MQRELGRTRPVVLQPHLTIAQFHAVVHAGGFVGEFAGRETFGADAAGIGHRRLQVVVIDFLMAACADGVGLADRSSQGSHRVRLLSRTKTAQWAQSHYA